MKIVVRVPNWIGDVVFALPALRGLDAHFADSDLRIAGPAWTADLLSGTEFAGRTITLGPAEALRAERFDTGILLTNSFASALLFRRAGIAERWGYRAGRAGLPSHAGRAPEKGRPPHPHGHLLSSAPRRAGHPGAAALDRALRIARGGGARLAAAGGARDRNVPAARPPRSRSGPRPGQALAGRPVRRSGGDSSSPASARPRRSSERRRIPPLRPRSPRRRPLLPST